MTLDAGHTLADGLVIRGLHKRYGDTVALDGLDLHARPGEILGVAGPNGAGKSTVIKVLAAETTADSGVITVGGVPWSPSLAVHRVAVVHQEPQLFPNLTVEENLVVGRERRRVLRHGANEQERALMADLAIAEFADRPLGTCTLAVQQRTEIARALAQDARLFLFDEPNSALTDEESDDLFRRMHALADAGHVVMLVSHRLAELVEHADRVAVIRDGRATAVLEGEALTQVGVARQLVLGQPERVVDEADVDPVDHAPHGSALTLSQWTHADGEFTGIDLAVDAGEIVAIVGVEGSGARELLRSAAGLERASGSHVVTAAADGPAIGSRPRTSRRTAPRASTAT
jgi:ABC-type sugar transport system ATPase subunit